MSIQWMSRGGDTELEERIETATAKLVAAAPVNKSVDKFTERHHGSL